MDLGFGFVEERKGHAIRCLPKQLRPPPFDFLVSLHYSFIIIIIILLICFFILVYK